MNGLRKVIPNSLVNYLKHLPDAILANIIYGFPSRGMTVIGVTGTDGKTTTVNMIYKILKEAGKKVSMVSTINAVIGDKVYDTGFHVTNPGRHDLQKMIKEAKNKGSEFLVLEATSQGLVQFRNWGINFYIGVITNITPEHLDYHKTIDNYVKAKALLIKSSDTAVLNKDDNNFATLAKMAKGKVVSISLRQSADLSLEKLPLKLKLAGEYNLSNALQAAQVGLLLGIDKDQIKKSLENFDSLPGRLESIPNRKGIKIIIDFAHTPNALEQAIITLKKETKGRMITVFGAASERDTFKRPLMGEIASRLSDVVILTDEDPRFENSNKIIEEIASGMVKKKNVLVFKIADRLQAIRKAIELSKRGDTIGIFGKGHETSMNYKGVERRWSDKAAVLKILAQNGRQ